MFNIDGDVVQSTITLLQSQKKYQKEIAQLYRKMSEKSRGEEDYEVLEQSLDGIIKFANELIVNSTEKIKIFEKNKSVDDGKNPTLYRLYVEKFIQSCVNF